MGAVPSISMPSKKKSRERVNAVKAASRALELQRRATHGALHAKVWSGLPNAKQERRRAKTRLRGVSGPGGDTI